MNFLGYKRVHAKDVAEELNERMEFSGYQRQKLEKALERFPYTFVQSPEKRKKSHPLFRLTLVFYPLFWLLLVFLMPVKWACSGNAYYNESSPGVKILTKWKELLAF